MAYLNKVRRYLRAIEDLSREHGCSLHPRAETKFLVFPFEEEEDLEPIRNAEIMCPDASCDEGIIRIYDGRCSQCGKDAMSD